jgi:hypothetical protein
MVNRPKQGTNLHNTTFTGLQKIQTFFPFVENLPHTAVSPGKLNLYEIGGFLFIAAGNSKKNCHKLSAETPFLWELAQHTLKITNSAGRNLRFPDNYRVIHCTNLFSINVSVTRSIRKIRTLLSHSLCHFLPRFIRH